GFLAFIILINLQVFNRYLLPFINIANITTWTEELSRYIFVFVSFLGASLAIRKNETIEVSFIVKKLPINIQNIIEITNNVFMVFFSYFMVKYGIELIAFQLETQQTTPAMAMPMAIPYSAVPIGFALIIIRTLQKLFVDTKGASLKEGVIAAGISLIIISPIFFFTVFSLV